MVICSGITKVVLVIGLGLLCLAANGTSAPSQAAGAGAQLPYPPGERFLIHPPVKPEDSQIYPDISGNIVIWLEYTLGGSPGHIYGYNLESGENFGVVTTNTQYIWNSHISNNMVIWNVTEDGDVDIYGRSTIGEPEFPVLTGGDWNYPDIDGNIVIAQGSAENTVWMYDTRTELLEAVAKYGYFPRISDGLITWRFNRETDNRPSVAIYNVSTGQTQILDTRLWINGYPQTNNRWVLVDAWWGNFGFDHAGVAAYNWDTNALYKVSSGDLLNPYITDEGIVLWTDYEYMFSYDMNSGARCTLNACYGCLNVESLNGDGNVIVWSDRPDPDQAQYAIYGMVVPTHDLTGDINCNNVIDTSDLQEHVARWHTRIGDVLYLPGHDRDKDGQIDIRDMMQVASAFGQDS